MAAQQDAAPVADTPHQRLAPASVSSTARVAIPADLAAAAIVWPSAYTARRRERLTLAAEEGAASTRRRMFMVLL